MKSTNPAVALVAATTAILVAATPIRAADTPPAEIPEAAAPKRHFTKIGMLSCSSDGGFGYVVGSSSDLSCTFSNRHAGQAHEYYSGSITKVGPDIGFKSRERLIWAVYAPSYQVPQGRLDGTYVGVSAAAGLGIGVGANVLVGNLKNNLNLVPVSVSGNIGLNASAGIGALTLSSEAASR
ncbi:DUF992 domain-containing protein [Hoeflea poritis]|uniref:DUF992 domain-containing protein n=1 Tax=Hoeflea poritis TaxID=2993659 RepID=A0ABT4VHS2_9HYPH|nr:DUF992 domain-containing protein [Hoeflea poritis]MDA4844232.1 DUF992 domain-containing protein [Hoeflea poritis]